MAETEKAKAEKAERAKRQFNTFPDPRAENLPFNSTGEYAGRNDGALFNGVPNVETQSRPSVDTGHKDHVGELAKASKVVPDLVKPATSSQALAQDLEAAKKSAADAGTPVEAVDKPKDLTAKEEKK